MRNLRLSWVRFAFCFLLGGLLLLPIAAAPLVAFTLGFAWFLASLGAYVRDVSQAVSVSTMVLFMMTPVLYPLSAVPESVRWIIGLNPLSPLCQGVRQVLVWGELPNWGTWALVSSVSPGVLLLGNMWFMKTKSGFADVL